MGWASGSVNPFRFILLLGTISIFADMTYEGARGSVGAYLAIMGASAAAVAFVIGFGEFIGYTPRLLTGSIIDRTGKYWTLMYIGYGINLVAVPMLALSGNFLSASILIIIERAGKAIRAPARDAMISYASVDIGRGWSFGVHEAFSSIGGILGPSIVAIVFIMNGSYELGFVLLAIPALISMILLVLTVKRYPNPKLIERHNEIGKNRKLPKAFWIYTMGASFLAIGFLDFPILSYHFAKIGVLGQLWIPAFYAIANASDALCALILGRLYDWKGMKVLIASVALAAIFPLLIFTGDLTIMLIGVMLWGMGVGVQESIMRGVVAQITPIDRRGSAYGLYSMFFGVFWFLGTALMGLIYSESITLVIAFSILTQLVAVIIFIRVAKRIDSSNAGIANRAKESVTVTVGPK